MHAHMCMCVDIHRLSTSSIIINPRRACAARVTLVTRVIFSVCLFHQYLTCSTSRSQNEGINLDYTCESRRKIICFV